VSAFRVSITAFTTVSMAVVDPMPTANAIVASSAIALALVHERKA
jgi:hypothetical protein